MSRADREADEVTLPVKRTDGDTIEERLTANAYENILPARYLRKNADGELVESQEELFERVAKNVALAEAVFEADQHDIELTVTPDQLKPDHPRRNELAAEVFGKGVTANSDAKTALTPYNVNKFAYETVVPELDGEVRTHVEETAEAFRESMEKLSFVPNSPTLMNAGDELQQLSACFVDSPADDMDDIYDTLRESAKVMQCLTEETEVFVEGNGLVSIRDVEAGDAIRQRSDGDHQFRTVEEKHAYEDRSVRTVRTEAGIEITGTPIHRLRVGEEWTPIENVSAGDELATALNWLPARQDPTLAPVESGPQWVRRVENAEIARLHARGLSDYEVADELSVSPSTVQRRRANELDLPPNGSGGRESARSFDEDEFERLYADGGTDTEIAAALDVTPATVQQHRNAAGHEPNGSPANEVAQPRSLTPELSTLVGLWVGDGSLHENGVRFHISRDEVLEYIHSTVRDLFDTGVSSTWAGGCYEVTINSHEVRRWWVENFGDGKPSSREANVPEVITRGGREHVAAFLGGLWTADGTLAKERYPRLDTSSPRLARQVQTLLLGLGIPASRQEVAGRDLYSVNPVTERGYKTFAELVGFVDARSRTLAESHAAADCYNQPTGRIEDGLWYQPVSAVEDAGTETVYDVTVREDPQYVANGVVSHNSGGGMGYAFWNLRPYGDTVGSSGGIASGPITFMRSYDSMCETIAQGGTRRGAQMGVMRVSHPDIIQFIHAKNKDVSLAHSLRLNDPDDFTHTRFVDALEEARELIDEEGRVPEHLRNAVEGHLSNFNISVGVTDDFMDALYADEEFTFTNPRTEEPHIATEETKELYECYGLGEHVEVGEELSIPAAELWDHIVDGAYQNGEPGVIYLERVNKEHSFDIEEYPEHEILATNPCGEQPLEEYEACNLGHINLSTLAATDAPDWRVWSDEHESEYDSREAAMEAYLDEAIDFEAFDRRIELGTRFLENVVTMSDFPVGKIEQKVREMRKIGLGIMGLAQLYIQLGVRYGSAEGNEIARQLMTHINHGSKRTSHELAGERGNFEDWEDSKYANPTEYREWFETQTGESADDWEDGFPIRNHNTTTIAPTGTTSMVGNTTGGCEPIYNVAYYKNVSDDVQGDEMLVEFDDYFLRVLEANDIDVGAVKEEAQEQMGSNEFDGVEGLETVPNAIGELFVVTADLSGKDHAAVQCACQAGVDSAISKTCNFPNSASKADMDEVYRYIYDNGGKGVTVYRDGTRSKQVLTTRADNAEFADEGEAATVIAEQIDEMFGGIEGFLDSEDVRAALDTDLESVISEPVYAEKQPRPDVLHGVTQRVDTGYGKLYVNINEDESGRPFELFANIGHSGGFTNSFTEALAKVISTALRSGVDPEEIVDELDGTRSPKVAWDKGEQIQSIPDAIGTAMRRYLDGEIEKTYPQQRNLAEIADEDENPETDGGPTQTTDDHQQLIDNGENPECPSCGALALYYSEGCKTCESCGWSEC